jgi:hypothetical protein
MRETSEWGAIESRQAPEEIEPVWIVGWRTSNGGRKLWNAGTAAERSLYLQATALNDIAADSACYLPWPQQLLDLVSLIGILRLARANELTRWLTRLALSCPLINIVICGEMSSVFCRDLKESLMLRGHR